MFKKLIIHIKLYVALRNVKKCVTNLYRYNHDQGCEDITYHPNTCNCNTQIWVGGSIAFLGAREVSRMLFNISKDGRLKVDLWKHMHFKLSTYQELMSASNGDYTVLSSRLTDLLNSLYRLKLTLTL